ncbi:aldehyde dehydrogenase family protein [Oleomonas cavernae]|uniref:Aldehyde dehydrogenase family protein n=1 Tax=Oleomonas cavernae TaxID=2320859 RepID=A0A418WB03_9PROT|nr:aldehyde dehydrogenase [Oleomonas cavernae]RJF87207.1 aldehyde dehydrogenase family protein [Oleomonas cavernae]
MAAALSLDQWEARAKALDYRHLAFIDGRFVPALSGKTFPRISPIDGGLLTQVAECDASDVDVAVAAARKAFEAGAWSRAAPKLRKKVLLKLAELMRRHGDELALLETLDMGKPIGDSTAVDVPSSANTIQWYAEAIDKVYDEIAPTAPNALGLVTREPIGVVAAVVPWNFPLLMTCWKLGPALATGNCVVLKPAEQSPLTALRLAELASEAGLPDGVLNVVPGFGETAGAALGLHMDVDAVTFTGSTQVGKFFLEYAGRSNMKTVSLECGGKSPHIVMADCGDLDLAATKAAWGIFYNQGEVCTAGSRLLVEEPIKDAFLDKLAKVAATIQPGNPLDPATKMGAMVDQKQMERVLDYIEKGKDDGAVVRLGGKRTRQASGGFYVEPTVFDKVSPKARIAQEEIFGPVLSTITFNGLEEAIRIGNDTIYGLAAAIWTKDIDQALKAARRLRSGLVWINGWDEDDITVPFGGFKQSGFGRDRSLHAMEKYTQLKSTWITIR